MSFLRPLDIWQFRHESSLNLFTSRLLLWSRLNKLGQEASRPCVLDGGALTFLSDLHSRMQLDRCQGEGRSHSPLLSQEPDKWIPSLKHLPPPYPPFFFLLHSFCIFLLSNVGNPCTSHPKLICIVPSVVRLVRMSAFKTNSSFTSLESKRLCVKVSVGEGDCFYF